MDLDTINEINNSPFQAFFAITGGGQSFLGDYMKFSGASKTVVGAIVPYNPVIFDNFIGNIKISSYASNEAARKLAIASFRQCLIAGVERKLAIGIGAANSLGKDNEREGREHRIHVAAHTWNCTYTIDVVLQQARTRTHEDAIAAELIFQLLNRAALGNDLPKMALNPKESFIVNAERDSDVGLMLCSSPEHGYIFRGVRQPFGKELAIYSGSWNPWHQGHAGIYQKASEILACTPYVELSLRNADKGTIDFIDLYNRMTTLPVDLPVILTQAPTYFDKVKLLRNVYSESNPITFIVGADTWSRIWDPKYVTMLGGDMEQYFADNNVKFLVFGRGDHPIVHPETLGEYIRIKDPRAEQYSSPISSTSLRQLK